MSDLRSGEAPDFAAGRTSVVDLDIQTALSLLTAGEITAVELLARHLDRIAAYDRKGPILNSVPVLNPGAFDDAAESDRRFRLGGSAVRPLEGIPFTVKDSFSVRGLTVANGSPAFAGLVAARDAFAVQALRGAGAVLIGKTNMPPMAAGGMQRGVYGRSESPYNPAYLAAAYASGSSHGSAVSTAAGLGMFGMGEETVSSGRSPASNNALCAYTPSRGVISIRGNWPLFASSDVVVPQCRTMADLLRVIEVLVVEDPETDGDFWRTQRVVALPSPDEVFPRPLAELREDRRRAAPLAGVRLGAPRMFLGADPDYPVVMSDGVRVRWEAARARLESLGADVVDCDFPALLAYEGEHRTANALAEVGTFPEGWMDREFGPFMWWGWDAFLRRNAAIAREQGDPPVRPASLAEVDGGLIFPLPSGALPDRYDADAAGVAVDGASGEFGARHGEVPARARAGIVGPFEDPDLGAGLAALEEFRIERFERWLEESELDGLVFPANGDHGAADADVDVRSADRAWANGVLYSNGNYMLRHLGIPTVTVPMGVVDETGMPVGVTFAGPAYADARLLGWGHAFEHSGALRDRPSATPELPGGPIEHRRAAGAMRTTSLALVCRVDELADHGATDESVAGSDSPEPPHRRVRVNARVDGDAEGVAVRISVDGRVVTARRDGDGWLAEATVPAARAPIGSVLPGATIVVALAVAEDGTTTGAYRELP